MPFLTTGQKAALAAELAKPEYNGLGHAAASDRGNAARTVPNPVAVAPRIPAPFTAAQFIGQLTQESAAKVFARPGVTSLQADIKAQDRGSCGNWVAFARVAADITDVEAGKLNGLLTATIADPSWAAQIPGPTRFQALNLGPIAIPADSGHPLAGYVFDGTCIPEFVEEARS